MMRERQRGVDGSGPSAGNDVRGESADAVWASAIARLGGVDLERAPSPGRRGDDRVSGRGESPARESRWSR